MVPKKMAFVGYIPGNSDLMSDKVSDLLSGFEDEKAGFRLTANRSGCKNSLSEGILRIRTFDISN
jgi:hypothetical protein